MTADLTAFVERALDAGVAAPIRALAAELARAASAEAVLFYGSNLRTGALDGVLDFYVLTPGAAERGLWPTVSYREVTIGGAVLRAKIATMRFATFAKAVAGGTIDTTIWARFAQPTALAWFADRAAANRTIAAVTEAAITAARFAAALGPAQGMPADYWRTLFKATYAAELRVERRGRHDQVIAANAAYYDALLPLAWAAGQIAFDRSGARLRPLPPPRERARWRRAWRVRQAAGKPLNVARLVRAAFTFDGAARYGAWKIERHTGIAVRLTPWRERHPVLAAPGVLWRVWRSAQR